MRDKLDSAWIGRSDPSRMGVESESLNDTGGRFGRPTRSSKAAQTGIGTRGMVPHSLCSGTARSELVRSKI